MGLQEEFFDILTGYGKGKVESRYEGGDRTSPEMYGDSSINESADSATEFDLESIRASSQNLYDNEGIAKAAVNRQHLNVIGTGMVPQSRVDHKGLGMKKEEASELENHVEREFGHFIYGIDYFRRFPFPILMGLLFKSALVRGDCFTSTPYRKDPDCVYGTKIQLIEADRVCNPNQAPDTKTMVKGVEKDQYGVPRSIHVLNAFPGEEWKESDGPKWMKLELFSVSGVQRVMQLIDPTRVDETRGVPIYTGIMPNIKQHKDLKRNELLASVINSLFVAFVKSEARMKLDRAVPSSKDQPQIGNQNNKNKQIAMGRGLIHYLTGGEEVQFADTKRPNRNYEAFVSAILREIAAGLDMPIEELQLYYQSSYSAARASILQAWKLYEFRRMWIGEMVLTPLWRIFWDEAVALGRIPVKNYADPARRLMYQGLVWNGPARGAINELDAINSSVVAIDNLLSTREREAQRLFGSDIGQVFNRLSYEKTEIQNHGLEAKDNEKPADK